MNKQRSVASYRLIDLGLFAVMLLVFESVVVKVSSGRLFRDQAFTVSLVGAITSIVYMRWGLWGGLHAFLGGIVYSLSGNGTWEQMLIYSCGNLLSLLIVPVMNRIGREKIRQSRFLFIPLGTGTLLLMQAGRMLLSLLFGHPAGESLRFITTDTLSCVFTLTVLWIVRRLDGVYEDQLHYLERINREMPGTEEEK